MPERYTRSRSDEEGYNDYVDVDNEEINASGWIHTEYEPEPEKPIVRIDDGRDPLVIWSDKFHGIPLTFWEDLGVRSEKREGGAGDRFISFNWPEGWKKVRDVYLRVDSKTAADRKIPRFRWVSPPPSGVHPIWPAPSEGKHPEVWVCEGESDTAVMRFLGFDAYTFGSCEMMPSDIELRFLKMLGVERAIVIFDADKPGREGSRGNGGSKRMTEILASAEIDAIQIDLGKILFQWKYLKDIRDLFNQLPIEDVKALLLGARASVLDDREEDILASKILENVPSPEWIMEGVYAKGALNLLTGAPKF